MEDSDVVYLSAEELTGDHVGFVQPGLVLLTGDGHRLQGSLSTGSTDGNCRRFYFTDSKTLLVALQAAGVTHHAVLAGVRTGRPFWFGTLRLFSQPELAGLTVRNTAGVVAVGAPTAPPAPPPPGDSC